MNWEFFKSLITSSTFEKLPEMTRALLNNFMSTPTIAMETEALTVKKDMSEVVWEAEETAPQVSKVLAEVPKSPWTPRPKPTPTKESRRRLRRWRFLRRMWRLRWRR